MKKTLRVVGWLVGMAGVVVLGGLVWLGIAYPKKQDPPDVRVEATPELRARGEYLFHSVAACAECHSPNRHDLAGSPADPERIGAGGSPFPLGAAGTLYAKNVTPAGLGEWTDGEIVRALRDGISRDGTALFPLMPYTNYRRLTERDVHSLVAYLRTLAPRASDVPERDLRFPMWLLLRLMPSPAGPYPEAPPASDPIARGRYLFTAASCADCHTPRDDRGRPIPGRELAGGSEFPIEGGWIVRTANITPDSVTGIGAWSRERFADAFKSRLSLLAAPRPPAPGERRSPMPWLAYARMTEADLGAIYDYLRTVEPVRHEVVRYAPREVAPVE